MPPCDLRSPQVQQAEGMGSKANSSSTKDFCSRTNGRCLFWGNAFRSRKRAGEPTAKKATQPHFYRVHMWAQGKGYVDYMEPALPAHCLKRTFAKPWPSEVCELLRVNGRIARAKPPNELQRQPNEPKQSRMQSRGMKICKRIYTILATIKNPSV